MDQVEETIRKLHLSIEQSKAVHNLVCEKLGRDHTISIQLGRFLAELRDVQRLTVADLEECQQETTAKKKQPQQPQQQQQVYSPFGSSSNTTSPMAASYLSAAMSPLPMQHPPM